MTHPSREATADAFDALTVPLVPGRTVVEASAGTGKTFAITRLVLRLLLEHRVESLSQILVVTFTEKATQELVTRIRDVLRLADRVWSASPPPQTATNRDLFTLRAEYASGGVVIARALASLDDLAVSTIHGFCRRILAECALETRMPLQTNFVENETEPLLRAAMDWSRQRLISDPAAAEFLVSANVDLAKMVRSFVTPFRRARQASIAFSADNPSQALAAGFTQMVSTTLDREKQRRHLIGFDDLLVTLADVLRDEGPDGPLARRIRARFGAALIDEFQDTDPTQFTIFDTAFAGRPLFLIGDPKQSIFRFRGADIATYLAAANDGARKYTLTQNYRSSATYVAAVQQLFTRAADPFRYPASTLDFVRVEAAREPTPPAHITADGKGALVWWWLDKGIGSTGKYLAKDFAAALLCRDVANEIVTLVRAGVAPQSIAVIVNTNHVAQQMKRALDSALVPSVVGGADDVLDSDEATEIAQIAAAVASPFDRRAVAVARSTRLWGETADAIAHANLDLGQGELDRISERFASLRDIWRTRGVAAALGDLFAARRSMARLLALPDGERRLTNVRHVAELLHEASVAENIDVDGVGGWLSRERALQSTPDRRELRLESDSAAVQILTIHKAKGLEFDIVFCPTLWQSHSGSAGPLGIRAVIGTDAAGGCVLDLGSPDHAARLALDDEEQAAESQRLAYVALTRAVHRCYVAFGDIGRPPGDAGNSPLGHLLRSDTKAQPRDVIAAMVETSDGGMTLLDVAHDGPVLRWVPPARDLAAPVAASLSLSSAQLSSWRSTSFTGLTADAPTESGRDVADPAVRIPEIDDSPATGFRRFPAGALPGVALHEIFERIDYVNHGAPSTRAIIQRSLAHHGLTGSAAEADDRLDDVAAMVSLVCTGTLPNAGFSLAAVSPEFSLREWRFDMSVRTTSVNAIADALVTFGSPHARSYAPLLRTLRDSDIDGYLSGVIDLLFERDGRWWIVDWKSNQLGASDANYAPSALDAVMMDAHYTLQYHIYLVAVHRYLRTRVVGYDPAVHWGGVVYVFLRGVRHSSDDGWFCDTPTPDLLAALDATLGTRA